MKNNNLTHILFDFTVRTIKFLKILKDSPDVNVIRYQLIKSSSSAGANYEASQAGLSKAGFRNKVRISLKEMQESNYWLRLIKEVVDKDYEKQELEYLINESEELKKRLGAIVQKSSNKTTLCIITLSLLSFVLYLFSFFFNSNSKQTK